jgi:hypothetical protein
MPKASWLMGCTHHPHSGWPAQGRQGPRGRRTAPGGVGGGGGGGRSAARRDIMHSGQVGLQQATRKAYTCCVPWAYSRKELWPTYHVLPLQSVWWQLCCLVWSVVDVLVLLALLPCRRHN